uniref:Secreted protein n=1 Tax=Steinernema glaseri TaxID=37863 RepID=A0A1I7ZB89_9BILA
MIRQVSAFSSLLLRLALVGHFCGQQAQIDGPCMPESSLPTQYRTRGPSHSHNAVHIVQDII